MTRKRIAWLVTHGSCMPSAGVVDDDDNGGDGGDGGGRFWGFFGLDGGTISNVLIWTFAETHWGGGGGGIGQFSTISNAPCHHHHPCGRWALIAPLATCRNNTLVQQQRTISLLTMQFMTPY